MPRPRLAYVALPLVAAVCGALSVAATAHAAPAGKPAACLTARFTGPAWTSVAGKQVRIHYRKARPADGRSARRLVTEVDRRIWPTFLRVLQRPPLSDARQTCAHGGDGRFDVYLTSDLRTPDGKKAPAAMQAYVTGFRAGEACGRRATLSVARPGVNRSILAHELYHAFQGAYERRFACFLYGSWDEATADWGMQYVYPDDQQELLHTSGIEVPDRPFAFQSYGGWVLPYYLERTQGVDAMRLREVWSERLDPDDAMDRAIDGGFAKVFPEFALHAWNQAPVGQSRVAAAFRDWDALKAVPSPGGTPVATEQLGTAGAHVRKLPLPVNLRVLEREYRRWRFDDGVRRITLENPLAGAPNGAIGAYVKVRGEADWRVEDWSGRQTVSFCRDRRDQDVEEIVVVFSDSSHVDRLRGERRLVLEDSCSLSFRVLSSAFQTHAAGQGPSILCGTVSGTRDFAGSSAEPYVDRENRLDQRSDGTFSGGIWDWPSAEWTNQVSHGCSLSPRNSRCTYTGPSVRPRPDGTTQIGFSIQIAPGSQEAQLDWAIPSPEIGYVDAGDPECNAHIWGPLTGQDRMHTPAAPFFGTAPFDVTFDGVAAVTAWGLGGTLDYAWSYRLQLQRVDGDGNPLA